jgi:membrane protein DedA with SNARE-associated domain
MIDILYPGSYLAIVVVLTLTGAGLPLPEEVPVLTAGVLAANGVLDPWLALASCIVGALAGDCIMYFIGYHFGRSVLKEHPWWVRFVTPEREAQVEQMFKRHGIKVFFIVRFLVLLRAPLLLSAGILRVSFRRFLLIDLLSASVVVSAFFGLGYQYGQTIGQWIQTTEVLLTVVAVIVLGVVAVLLWRRHRRKLAGHAANPPGDGCSVSSAPADQPQDEVEQIA